MVIYGPDAVADQANWLDGLSSHAIFSHSSSRIGRQCMVVRNSDLILASDKSLRMTSLLEVKHKDQSSSASQGTFKELVSDALDFEIAGIILNPTGKLVAVVGSHKIVVVVLPRIGVSSGKSVGAKVSVKAATVGSFYFHERVGGRARLASVKWHPWGHLGSSLLVMSKDGLLREFDVSNDVQEPVQTVSLLPSSPKAATLSSVRAKARMKTSLRSRSRSQTPSRQQSARSSSRIALDDDDENSEDDYLEDASSSRHRSGTGPAAVTFTFGIDTRNAQDEGDDRSAKLADWKPLSLYTLCSNGDVYALCPFMPKNASMPFSYISSLSSLVSAQSSSPGQLNGDIQNRYLASLLKQASTTRRDRQPSSSPTRSRRSVSFTPMSVDPRASAVPDESVIEDEINDEVVYLQAPPAAMVPRQPRPQGPFLFWPAPVELSEDRENISTDLFFARAESGQNTLDVLGILGDDGRVDLCLMLEATEPIWGESLALTPTRKRVVSSGRYALSDSDDDDDDDDAGLAAEVKPLPTLFVYETIDLGIFSGKSPPVQVSVLPQFVLDPLYSDTFYVQHATGAHAVGFGRWSKDLLDAMALSEVERAPVMERVLHTATPSDVIRVVDSTDSSPGSSLNEVTGLCIISDIYLSYSFLALMQSGALVALELGLRVEGEDDGNTSVQAAPLSDLQAGPAPYTSLLGDGPSFAPPEPFKTVNGLPYHPRSAIKGRHSSQEVTVSTETLRILATVVSTLRGEMRKIVQGGNVVQSRLELQIKELNRQLSKLHETRNRLDQGKTRQDKLDRRVKQVVEKQGSLIKKSDWLLQKLVENHSPEVSIYEARWFKELERLKEDVGGKMDTDEAQGLQARVKQLQYQLEVLRPDLIKMKDKSTKDASEMMGAKQLQSIESMLAKEAHLLATNRDKISHLQSRMQRQNMYY